MDIQELISKELNKLETSKIDLHLIMETYINNNKNIYNTKEKLDHQATFSDNPVILALTEWCKKNNFEQLSENNFHKRSLIDSFYVTNYSGNNSFHIEGPNLNLYIQSKYIPKDKNIFYNITEGQNKSNGYIRSVQLGKTLTSAIILYFNENINFSFETKTILKDKYKTTNKYCPPDSLHPAIHVDQNTLQDRLHKVFKLIPDAIIKNTSLKDLFEIFHIQYDFNNKKFENNLISYVEDSKTLEKHEDLLIKIKNISNKNTIKNSI